MKAYRVIGSDKTKVKCVTHEVPVIGRTKGIKMLWGLEIVGVDHELCRGDIGQYAAVIIEIKNEDPWIIEGDIHDYTRNTITVDVSDMVRI